VANEDESQVDSIAVGYTSLIAAKQGKAFFIPETPDLTRLPFKSIRFR